MKKNLIKQSFLLKENEKQKGKYGWINEETGKWLIPPIYNFNYAMCLDFEAYFKALDNFKPDPIKGGKYE